MVVSTTTTTTRLTTTRCCQSSNILIAEKMEYVTLEEIYEAYYDCRKKKRRKASAVFFELHYETYLRELHEELNSMSYTISTSIAFGVTRPKHREVFAASFRDRIVHHLLMMKLEPILESEMIDNSYNCRKGKGTECGVNTLAEQIKTVSQNYTRKAYVLQCDLQGFFMSIEPSTLWKMLEKVMKRKWCYDNLDWWLWLIKMIVTNRPEKNCVIKGNRKIIENLPDNKTLFRSKGKGLPIGNLTSQIFGNYYLTPFDWWLQSILPKGYETGRFVDDFYIVGTDRKRMMKTIPAVRQHLKDNYGLTLHPHKVMITECKKGVKFIGAVIKPWGVYISNRTVGHAFEVAEITNVEDMNRHMQRLNSYFGFMRHRLTYAIRWRLFNAIPQKVKKKLVCVNMEKFQVRCSGDTTKKVALLWNEQR